MSNIGTNAGFSGPSGVNESGASILASGSAAPQHLQNSTSTSSFPQARQQSHQPQMHLHQHQTSHQHVLPANGVPQNQMYLNTNMAQAAAFAAATSAAQQFVQTHMGIAQNNGNNIPQNPAGTQGANGPGFNQDAMNMNMGGLQVNEQIAAYAQQMQQNQMNVQTQAQIAAILAASVGNNMMFNQSQAPAAPAFAAAQAFALMLNQQQAMASHQQQSMQAPAPNPTHQQQTQSSPAPQRTTQVAQPQQINAAGKHSSSPQPRPTKASTRTPTPTVQQSAQNGNSQGPKRKKVKKQQKQKEVGLPLSSTPSSFGHQTVKQLPVAPFQMPVATTSQLASAHHNSMPVPQHGHGLFQTSINPIVLSQMQSWKLNQLESHIQLLHETNQPIPHAVQILVGETRKSEQRRSAKRIANRKSACTSRARKKALVAEMTKTNARLRRQAVILSLLPDLVIAIQDDGTITFCSAQVERVLRHKVSHMIGANIGDVLTPASRTSLFSLIKKLVSAEKAILGETNNKEGDESGRSSNSGNTLSAAIVSEPSDHFPPSVVKVKSLNRADEGNDVPNSLGNGNTAVTDAALSATQSSLTNTNQSNIDGYNVSNQNGHDGSTGSTSNDSGKRKSIGNSDEDSSSSSEPKNLRKANEALSRNVRFHNEQLKIKEDKKKLAHTDDVTGDSVTANNADARLSSLMKASEVGKVAADEVAAVNEVVVAAVQEGKETSASNLENVEDNSSSSSTDSLLAGVEDRPGKRKRAENASDDSGYRQSGESDPSREDCALSTSDASNGRPRPLAPTCNICLIRDDLTTIWCEVTSSIRTVTIHEEESDIGVTVKPESPDQKKKRDSSSSSSDDQQGSNCSSTETQVKELLLCLRPTRDGADKVSEELRFVRKSERSRTTQENKQENCPSGLNVDASTSNSSKSDENVGKNKNVPMKKRPLPKEDADLAVTPQADDSSPKKDIIETEKSVVESLMLMSNN